MKSRTRLTVLFTCITAAILLAFAAVIYFSAKENREKEFYNLLRKEAITKANLFFNANIDRSTLQDIYRSNRKVLNEVEVAIYDTEFNLLYHDAADIDIVKETKQMIQQISQLGEISFYQGDWQILGLRYGFQGRDYIVTAAAYDQHGYVKMDNLLRSCVIVFIISMLVIYIAGRFFSRKAFEPVKAMTEKAANISATNLDLRLSDNGKRDELSELANTFNEMLDRLENSFDAQKSFVSNISHELRTPLAAIIAELELAAGKDQDTDHYKVAIHHVLSDAKKITRLINSLLDMAKASYDPSEISFKLIRIDEVLVDARHQVLEACSDYRIDLQFDAEFFRQENDGRISIKGNEYLLRVAFSNLLENGCRFSEDQRSVVSIAFASNKIALRFADNGIGIPEEDLDDIFTPFYRGNNSSYADGNGIGLSLTQKIIALHGGTISVHSKEKQGSTFTVEFPTVNRGVS